MAKQPSITPASITEIREACRESQADFGEMIEVSPSAVSRWEQGKMLPKGKNIDAIRDCIPDSLEEENLIDNLEVNREWEGQLSSEEYSIFASESLQSLRDQPLTAEELPFDGGMSNFPGQQRQFVGQLKVGTQLGAAKRHGEKVTTVYYLEGDERRAIRRFIELNEEIVAEATAQTRNRFQHEWSDFLYGLLEEEWWFWLYR